MYILVNEYQFKKCNKHFDLIKIDEPMHIIEVRFAIIDKQGNSEVRSVHRLAHDCDIEATCNNVISLYTELERKDAEKVRFIDWKYILKDIGSYNLAIISPSYIKSPDDTSAKLVTKM